MITPMIARLISDLFDREGWFFELKWDGFRALAEIDSARKVKQSWMILDQSLKALFAFH